MNKLFKIVICGISLLLFFSCNNNEQAITINCDNTIDPIIVRMTREDNSIISIKFPQKILIQNNSFFKKSFIKIEYRYNNIPLGRNYGIGLYEQKNEILVKISNNKKKTISPKNQLVYVLYTSHYIDSTKSVQQQLKPYVEKMLRLKKDTLRIGTVVEFKQKHKELFENLTRNDSVSIRFLNSSTKSGLGERIAVPVKW
ncbi:MAG: hypothetical protein ACERIH_10420 [Labilibaculum antarcticum]